MNVVNTSDNSTVIEPQGSAHSPQTEQASCLFYSVVHDKNMSITNLPLLKPAANHQTPQASVMENWENNNQPDWIAEPDSDHQAVVNSEFQQLLALNQELCATNTSLYAQVGQLKDELAGAEKILQWQKTRSAVTESMLTEQTQELSSAQEQIKSLSNQLEAALQTVQHQEIFLETYKSQLQLSQQRLAQLERECSLLQGNYSEQSQQLLQSESTCRELRSRLMRQQRQTLQFKVALEKCLDTPVPNYDTLEDNSHPSQDIHCGQTRFSRKARSLFPNAQPIKPWSAEAESGSLSSSSWVESVLPPLYNSDDPTHPTTVSTSTQPHESNISTPTQTTSPPVVDEQVNHASEPISLVNNSSNLDQHLESLIQMFFASQDGSVTPFNPLTTTDKELSDQSSDEANTPVGEILTSIPEGTQKSEQQPEIQSEEQLQVKETVTAHPNSISAAKDGGTLTTYESPVNSNSSLGEANTVNDEDYWAEVSTTVIKLPEQDGSVVSASLDEYSPESRSPSPLIYPQRPPKGRKSLAAVELPNFRPLREKGSGVRNGEQGEN
jgi:hypothetical protein